MVEQRRTVFLGLSGGVDSAVAAALLLEQGYDVVPVFYKCWEELNAELSCPWREDQEAAFEVAKALGIADSFRSWNFTEEFTKGVIEKLADVARAGGTGNPDIDCNRIVKFGLFYECALAEGADFIATGHYARIRCLRDEAQPKTSSRRIQHPPKLPSKVAAGGHHFQLLRARCAAKNDQTYFLAQAMTQEVLARTLFPIGEFESKEAVREEARRRKLSCADRRSSRGVCLVGKDGEKADYAALLRHFIPAQEGAVVTTEGKRVGTHQGVPFYTRGQREGLGLTHAGGGPYYVVGKDLDENVLCVAPPADAQSLLWDSEITVKDMHWIAGHAPRFPLFCEAFVRHPQSKTIGCEIFQERQVVHISFSEPQRALTIGQSVVLYNDEIVLGGGTISNVL